MSTTSTKLFVRLVPDAQALRIGIEASGVVFSETTSNAGPATFRNQGQSDFMVRKLVLVTPDGLHAWPAVADANNVTDLQSMDTNYDGVPIVRSLARNIARSQYDQKREDARWRRRSPAGPRPNSTRGRPADRQARDRSQWAAQRVEPRSVGRLATSDKRIMARVRFAGGDQLAANTPRPQAPSDSLASMQVHQSALNNVLERLELDGKTFTLPELYKWIAAKFGRPARSCRGSARRRHDYLRRAHDAVSVQCREGQLELTVGIAELIHEQSKFRNFQVRALYRPASERLQMGLQREGSDQSGRRAAQHEGPGRAPRHLQARLPAGKPISLIPDEMWPITGWTICR